MAQRRRLSLAAICAGALALAGCNVSAPPPGPAQPAPAPLAAAAPVPQGPTAPSAKSAALATYYARLQNDLQVRGLLRTDGGGPDTPYTSAMLARNFEQIVFFDEYAGSGFRAGNGAPGRLRRWNGPVRFDVEFGASVTPAQQARDRAFITRYAARLASATRHPIGVSSTSANFHVLIMGEDDSDLIRARVRALVPSIDNFALRLFTNLPREIHCLVIAFSDAPGSSGYGRAIALIRSEHGDLMRRSCIHEELAQGLGLANDSPGARPSIFNDDEEFALLTTHDAHLLGMLYDRRLQTGMSLPAARATIQTLATERTGAGS